MIPLAAPMKLMQAGLLDALLNGLTCAAKVGGVSCCIERPAQESNTSVVEATSSLDISDSEHQLNGSESNGSVSDVQTALLARSTRTSAERINASRDEDLEESLDSVVSAKFFGDVFNTFKGAANAIASAGTWVAPLPP